MEAAVTSSHIEPASGETITQFGPQNPFFHPSELPFRAPPFDSIKNSDYEPAMLAGMAAQALEVRAIAQNASEPTFDNTLVALEQSGALLDRVLSTFGAIAGAYTNPVAEQLQQEMAPKLSAHADAIYLDAELFQRVETLYQERDRLQLDGEPAHLLEIYYQRFIHAGARLNQSDKIRLIALNAEESTLSNGFSRKLLAANNAGAFVTTDKTALAGLSEAQIESAAATAVLRGHEGFVIPLQNTTQQPIFGELAIRSTRQAIFERSQTRTEHGDENDTREIVSRLAQLRADKAQLLGFGSYAAWKLDNQMAKTPDAAIKFLDALVPAAVQRARQEQNDVQAAVESDEENFAVEPWDWPFYAEKVRRTRYELDEEEIRPYFEVRRVLEGGVFYAATRLYGITFVERHDLPVYAPDVRVFEVFNEDRSHLALFYVDLWKRDNKRGGAWMSSFVGQSRLEGTSPVIYNVSNFSKPVVGQPGLISFNDVTTMFHEFGHALHGMLSDVVYPSLAGTSVPRDFVEFPSQFNEHWALESEVFANYAKHCVTGEPMPEELAEKMKTAATFNQGYELAELLAAAQVDMQWHTLPAGCGLQEPEAFEAAALERKGLALAAIPPRYRSSYFAHIWGGGYAAGYYAYLWSEMLEYAAIEWFDAHGGLRRENGDRLRQMILSRGYTEEINGMVERWLGERPKIDAMLRHRGLIG